jgi:hypothetical protein
MNTLATCARWKPVTIHAQIAWLGVLLMDWTYVCSIPVISLIMIDFEVIVVS